MNKTIQESRYIYIEYVLFAMGVIHLDPNAALDTNEIVIEIEEYFDDAAAFKILNDDVVSKYFNIQELHSHNVKCWHLARRAPEHWNLHVKWYHGKITRYKEYQPPRPGNVTFNTQCCNRNTLWRMASW